MELQQKEKGYILVIPLDINKVTKAAKNIQDLSIKNLDIDIYVDKSSSQRLYNSVVSLFDTDFENVDVKIIDITQDYVDNKTECDLAIIVCGDSQNCALSYINNVRFGNPVCMITAHPHYILQDFAQLRANSDKNDIICPTISSYNKTISNGQEIIDFSEITDAMLVDIIKKLSKFITWQCRDKKLSFGRAFSFTRDDIVESVIKITSLENAGIGLVPFIPGADMPIMTLNQAKMLLQIASVYCVDVAREKVAEIAVMTVCSVALRKICSGLKNSIPAPDSLINAAFGYAGTYLLGRISLQYFKFDGKLEDVINVVTDIFGNIEIPENVKNFLVDLNLPEIVAQKFL